MLVVDSVSEVVSPQRTEHCKNLYTCLYIHVYLSIYLYTYFFIHIYL